MATSTDRNPVAAADAFKAVADQWMHTRMVACNLVALTTAAEVAFVSILWRMTGDITAPVTAAMMLTGVDYAFMKKLVDARMKRPE